VGDRFTGESHRDLLGAVAEHHISLFPARLVIAELLRHRPRNGDYGMALLETIGTADTPFGPANFP
jgi:hypothetical protein